MNRNAHGTATATKTTAPQKDGETVFIEPASGYNSRTVRDIILRDIFDYSPQYIIDFNKQYSELYVISDKLKSGVWATEEQVKGWKDFTTGLISVFLRNDWLTFIRNFRYQKIFTAITSAIGAIDDAEVAARVREYLEKILNSFEDKRTDAFNNLLTEITARPKNSRQIGDALSYVLAQGNNNNPFLTIALAKVYQVSGDAPDIAVLTMLARTNQLISKNLYDNPSKSKITHINRLEAAGIYGWVRDTYGQLGAAGQETYYGGRVRLLEMSDEERSNYKEGDLLEILRLGAEVVNAPSVNERNLIELEQKETARRNIQSETSQMPSMPVSDDNPGQLTSSDKVYVGPEKIIVEQKNRHKFNKSYVGKYKIVDNPERVVNLYKKNDENKTSPANVGNALYVVAEFLKFVAVHRQMMELADYWDKKRELQKAIYNSKYRLVPPKPQKVSSAITAVQNYARTSANPSDKPIAIKALQQLNIVLEDSRAFWEK